ncbi:MAG TPA: VOC family protein [Methylomirabilota bacterium]|jgi:extradiol dioxygenase family protein|nr:VOC family protein [Methylomirabilota bacterium]
MGRLSIVVLFTPELARQREFYEKSLGMSAGNAAERWVAFGTRDAALALRALGTGEKPRIELGFDVGALDSRLAQLDTRGIKLAGKLEESADCRIARVADPEGNVIQLIERTRPMTGGTWPRLSHAIVNAKAFDACAHFYHDTLGFKMAEEREHWIEFDTGGARLTLHAWRDADGLPLSPDQRVSFALMDDDLDAWADELRGRGVRFATTPTEEEMGRMAEVEDADGWFVVLRGPSPDVPIEEALAEDYADEDGTRIEQIRKTTDVEPGARPGFGSRKLARKKIERVATKGFDALQKTRDADRGGFSPGGGGGSRPFTPRPEGSRPFTPRPEGSRPFTPRPEGSRPFTPRPEGSRPFTPRPDRPPRPDGPRPYSPDRPPRPDGPRPYPPPAGPQPRSDRPGGTGPRPYTPRPEGPRPGGPPRRDGGTGPRPGGARPGGPREGGPPRGPRRDER